MDLRPPHYHVPRANAQPEACAIQDSNDWHHFAAPRMQHRPETVMEQCPFFLRAPSAWSDQEMERGIIVSRHWFASGGPLTKLTLAVTRPPSSAPAAAGRPRPPVATPKVDSQGAERHVFTRRLLVIAHLACTRRTAVATPPASQNMTTHPTMRPARRPHPPHHTQCVAHGTGESPPAVMAPATAPPPLVPATMAA